MHWVLVSIPDRKLALFENGRVVRLYRVAVGKTSTPSPAGEFKIVNRVTNPTYYHKGQVIGAGKGNPVGTRWMGLSAKGYGIHGTNQPNSIGKAASTGCIRMGKQDLEELFAIVDVGDTVQIRAERDEQIAAVFGSERDRERERDLKPEPRPRRSRRSRPKRARATANRRHISCRDEACLVSGRLTLTEASHGNDAARSGNHRRSDVLARRVSADRRTHLRTNRPRRVRAPSRKS